MSFDSSPPPNVFPDYIPIASRLSGVPVLVPPESLVSGFPDDPNSAHIRNYLLSINSRRDLYKVESFRLMLFLPELPPAFIETVLLPIYLPRLLVSLSVYSSNTRERIKTLLHQFDKSANGPLATVPRAQLIGHQELLRFSEEQLSKEEVTYEDVVAAIYFKEQAPLAAILSPMINLLAYLKIGSLEKKDLRSVAGLTNIQSWSWLCRTIRSAAEKINFGNYPYRYSSLLHYRYLGHGITELLYGNKSDSKITTMYSSYVTDRNFNPCRMVDLSSTEFELREASFETPKPGDAALSMFFADKLARRRDIQLAQLETSDNKIWKASFTSRPSR